MTLEIIDIFSGVLSVAIVTTYFIVGLNIAARYFQYNQKEFLYFGISWAGISSPWWPSSISFLMYIATGEPLPLELYLLIGNLFIPFLLHMWIAGVSSIIFQKWKQSLLILNANIGVIFELFFFYFLVRDITLLGKLTSAVDIKFSIVLLFYIFYAIVLVAITVSLLGFYSLKSNDPELKLKGKLILLGIFSWIIGAVMDAVLPLDPITLFISRAILITGAFEFYGGLMMPSWIRNLFLKELDEGGF